MCKQTVVVPITRAMIAGLKAQSKVRKGGGEAAFAKRPKWDRLGIGRNAAREFAGQAGTSCILEQTKKTNL